MSILALHSIRSSVEVEGSDRVMTLPRLEISLRETERAVLKLWGSDGLENLHALGERIAIDRGFDDKLSRLGRRDSAEAHCLLAPIAPDLLLNAYVLDACLGGAASESFFKGLPETGLELRAVALALQRFSSAEIRAVISREQEIFPELGTPKVFSQFSAEQIATFGTAQLSAYLTRLSIQPGGAETLESLQTSSRKDDYDKLVRAITVTSLEKIVELGAPTLQLIRELTRSFDPSNWQPVSAQYLVGRPIDSLESLNGGRLTLPPSLVERLRKVHHSAWLDARALLENPLPQSISERGTSAIIPMGAKSQSVLNMNNINGLTLAAQIGHLPDSLFERMLLASQRGSHEVNHETIRLEVSGTSATAEKTPVATSILSRRLVYPEVIGRVNDLSSDISNYYLKQDYSLAQPVFRAIDQLNEPISGKVFLQNVDQLRDICKSRNTLTDILRHGLLSLPVQTLEQELFDKGINIKSMPVEIGARVETFWKDGIDRALAYYAKGREGFTLRKHAPCPEGFVGSEVLTLESLECRYPDLVNLIDPNTVNRLATSNNSHQGPLQTNSNQRGGLMPADYSREYFTDLLQAGNHALIRPKNNEYGGGLDGLFIYYRKGNYPASISELMQSVSPLGDVAYESLFVTAPDRTPGTYMMLLRGMIARQALAGVRFSMGTVRDDNQHHFQLLKAIDHYPLHGAPVSLDSHGIGYIPMLWRLPGG